MKISKLFLILLFFGTILPASAFGVDTPQTVSGTVDMKFDLSRHDSSGITRLWVPYPESDRYQLISDIKIAGDYDYYAVYTEKKFQRPMLYVQWKPGTVERHVQLSFHVIRNERHDAIPAGKEPCWDKRVYSRFLEPAGLVPTDGDVQELAYQITYGCDSVRDRVMAIYDWLINHMERKPESKFCGDGDVLKLLKERRGNCVDIHSVFVALARAAGVPAREVFGIRLPATHMDGADITKQEHCWAEYFQPGYGWVVVDPADVLKKMLMERLAPETPEAKAYYRYFMGTVDACRLRFGLGRDITLNPAQKEPALNYFMYPYAEAGNSRIDFLNDKAFEYHFRFFPDNK